MAANIKAIEAQVNAELKREPFKAILFEDSLDVYHVDENGVESDRPYNAHSYERTRLEARLEAGETPRQIAQAIVREIRRAEESFQSGE